MLKYKDYVGVVQFDDEAMIFHGEVVGLKDVITFQGTTPEEIKREFKVSVDGYLDSVKKSNSRPFALNQVTEKEYENMWADLNEGKLIASPFTVFDFGVTTI